jgi:hypothetical protein
MNAARSLLSRGIAVFVSPLQYERCYRPLLERPEAGAPASSRGLTGQGSWAWRVKSQA